jgi:hypothetical protein
MLARYPTTARGEEIGESRGFPIPDALSIERIGILRLRKPCASRKACFAQNDRRKFSRARASAPHFPSRTGTRFQNTSREPRRRNTGQIQSNRRRQRLEGVASGYWTMSVKHSSGCSATRVRLPSPPRSLEYCESSLTVQSGALS